MGRFFAVAVLLAVFGGTSSTGPAVAQSDDNRADDSRVGLLIDVPHPLSAAVIDALASQLTQLAATAGRGDDDGIDRTTVVMKWGGDRIRRTEFESSLKLARLISGKELRRLRIVAWVDAGIRGHEVLPVLAAESMVVSPDGSLGDASLGEPIDDETIELTYQSIAGRRGVFADAILAGMLDPTREVAQVTAAGQPPEFLSGEQLGDLRRSGDVVEESIWSVAGEPLVLSPDNLRQLRAAIAIVQSTSDVADRLNLSQLREAGTESLGPATGVLLPITGPIGGDRVRRWTTNLTATTESGEINTWLIRIDSPGGDLVKSASLAAVLADPGPTIQSVGGLVSGQARGDAALIAVACRPLLMQPNATLGGGGADAMTPEQVERQSELIRLVAASTRRSETLIRGLLDPTLTIYQYTNRQTGRVRFATAEELNAEMGAEVVPQRWQRGEQIDLTEPLSPGRAVELGLADGDAADLSAAAAAVGLTDVPDALSDRGLVRWVEKLGRNDGLAFIVLLVGFMMLSTEMSAPGLGLPGFVAMICFGFFFWCKFLAGTAEWLELLAFGMGLACLAIEIFVLPGFGVFGIGGMFLTVLGVVLMSQTFVIPRNAYQINELTRGASIAMASMGGLLLGFIAVRAFLPRAAVATGLSMGTPNAEIDDNERIARFDHLLGQSGVTVTPLRPSGKARFGDLQVAVISDAAVIEPGQSIRVLQVQGNRIVVEATDS